MGDLIFVCTRLSVLIFISQKAHVSRKYVYESKRSNVLGCFFRMFGQCVYVDDSSSMDLLIRKSAKSDSLMIFYFFKFWPEVNM